MRRYINCIYISLPTVKSVQSEQDKYVCLLGPDRLLCACATGKKLFSFSHKSTLTILDRVFLRFIRCTLGIKCTTSNIIVLGECGRMPPSVMCTINTLCFFNRLNNMDDDYLVKQVYMELQRLTEHGFDTWVSSLRKLADSYQLNAYVDPNKFRQ